MYQQGGEEHEGQASQHESLDSVFELSDVEVTEQPRLHVGEFHIRQQLSFMDPLQSVDAFQLNNQFVFDQQINSVATIQLNPFELNGLRCTSIAHPITRFERPSNSILRALRVLRVLRGYQIPAAIKSVVERWR